MSYTFEEIMKFHSGNITVYNKVKELLVEKNLFPFVGAGLTQFAYGSWLGLLKKLSKKLTNKKSRATVNALIKAGEGSDATKLLDAAQALEDLRGKSNLELDLAELLSPDNLEQNRDQLSKESISLLPYLFNGLVITTNFDQTLETVYKDAGRPFDRTFLPGRPGFLNQLSREGGARCLYKLHGTLAGKLVDYESIVFTKKQYDKHYGENSPLTLELKDYFKKKVMLFLGCSLNNDRTMELLQEVIQPGDHYYTIINCKRSERDEKLRQLADKHIRAIVYEGNRHEAVRVILEHLLEETNPVAYNALPFHVGALKQANSLDRFSYESDFIPFTGRTSELQKLKDFLGDPNVPFRWWAVTGQGGSGKSRLVYEFQKKHLPRGWTARYLKRSDYENLASLTREITQKELIIADYMQEHAKEIGAWMEQLNENPHSLPIRVLLVEREADDNRDTTAWTKQLYEKTRHTTKVKGACYQEEFLKLQPLCDADLLEIIENYAKELNKKALTDAEKQMLLDKLKSVDTGLCRPLYAMFLTDAYVEGKNPERWNKKEILDYVTEREKRILKFNMDHALGKADKTLYTACLHLLSMATVLQDASLEELQKLCPDLWKTIEKKADDYDDVFDSPVDMLEQVGLAVTGQVPALRPDLIGEYYVYTWLLDHRDKAKEFLFSAWQKPFSTYVFFDRLLKDYYYLLNESADNWELILPEAISLSEDIALDYARTLVNATYYCKIVKECERQVKMQEAIVKKYPKDSDIALAFAKGLVNLSCEQDEQGSKETVARLERLAKEHEDVTEIAIELAKGLVNLSAKQDELGGKKTVARLESLAKEHKDVTEIAIEFAKGLVNLSYEQDEQGAKETVARLESLAKEHKEVPEIAIAFAKGLFNLSNKQDEQGRKETVARLERLAKEYKDVPEIAIEFANGLVNLSNKQDEQGRKETVARLESLANEHKDVTDIAISFAMGLVNLSNKQDEQGAQKTIARFNRFISEHPEVIQMLDL